MKPLLLTALLLLAACDPSAIVFHAIETTYQLSQPPIWQGRTARDVPTVENDK